MVRTGGFDGNGTKTYTATTLDSQFRHRRGHCDRNRGPECTDNATVTFSHPDVQWDNEDGQQIPLPELQSLGNDGSKKIISSNRCALEASNTKTYTITCVS